MKEVMLHLILFQPEIRVSQHLCQRKLKKLRLAIYVLYNSIVSAGRSMEGVWAISRPRKSIGKCIANSLHIESLLAGVDALSST